MRNRNELGAGVIQRRTAAVTAILVLVLAGCARRGEDPDHPLGRLLLTSIGRQYETVPPPASGPLDLDSASGATSSPRNRLRRQLSTTGFQGGYARVWQRTDDDFVAVLLFEFLTERRASELVGFMDAEHEDDSSAQRFTVPRIPGAVVYTLNALSPRTDRSLFCQIVWFPRGTAAFEVRVCAGQPSSANRSIELAHRQLRAAGRR